MTKKSLDKLREEKFGTNTFALKYQKDLEQSGFVDEILENAEQVKSWNRYDRSIHYSVVASVSLLLGLVTAMIIVTPSIIGMCS